MEVPRAELQFEGKAGKKTFILNNGRMAVIDGLFRKHGINVNCGVLCNNLVQAVSELRSAGLDDDAIGAKALTLFPHDVLVYFLVGACEQDFSSRQILEACDEEPEMSIEALMVCLDLLIGYYNRVSKAAEAKKKRKSSQSSADVE